MKKKYNVSRERKFSPHHILLGSAKFALEQAEKREPGWLYAELTAITMSALAIEAICNAFGDRIISEWKDFDSLNPIAKLRLICEKLGITFDVTEEPWVTAKWLYKLRNEVVHAKPQLVIESTLYNIEEYDKYRNEYPKSKLEKKVTLNNAKNAVKCVYEIKNILFKNVKIDETDGLYSDSWFGAVKLLPDDG